MTDGNQVNPNYQGLADGTDERRQVAGALSETQKEIAELAPGERWGLTATERSYRAGGNEGDFSSAAEDGTADEEGYPTPS